MKNKKAIINLSSKWIVITIIALVLGSMLIGFIRYSFKKAGMKFEEHISSASEPPDISILNPRHGDRLKVFQDIEFKSEVSYESRESIKSYHWDFHSDGEIDSNEDNTNYSYIVPGEYKITLKTIDDMGSVSTAEVTILVVPDNVKDQTKYQDNPAFLIPITDKEGILRCLTLMFDENVEKYPCVAYYIAPFSIIGHTLRDISSLSLVDYQSYWIATTTAVLVASPDSEGALLAALYSAFTESLLFFESDISTIAIDLSEKTTYIIDQEDFTVDALNPITGKKEFLSRSDLENPQTNPYSKIHFNISLRP